jgi:hypothetical protein
MIQPGCISCSFRRAVVPIVGTISTARCCRDNSRHPVTVTSKPALHELQQTANNECLHLYKTPDMHYSTTLKTPSIHFRFPMHPLHPMLAFTGMKPCYLPSRQVVTT